MTSGSVTGTQTGLYLIVLLATLLLGMAEVLRDNSAQTILPAIVAKENSSRRPTGGCGASRRVANTFVGPPLGSLLLAGAFALPFFLDAASFFVAAALVFLIPGMFRADGHDDARDASRGAPSSARASAGCGGTACCARWPSSSG